MAQGSHRIAYCHFPGMGLILEPSSTTLNTTSSPSHTHLFSEGSLTPCLSPLPLHKWPFFPSGLSFYQTHEPVTKLQLLKDVQCLTHRNTCLLNFSWVWRRQVESEMPVYLPEHPTVRAVTLSTTFCHYHCQCYLRACHVLSAQIFTG